MHSLTIWLCLTLCHLCIFVHVSEERPQISSVPNSFEHNWSVLLASTKTASSWLFLILPKVAHGSATYLTRIFCYWCSGLSNPSIAQSTEIQSTQTKVCLCTTSRSVLQSPVLHLTLITRNPHGGVAILIWKARSWQRCPFPRSLKKYASNIHS